MKKRSLLFSALTLGGIALMACNQNNAGYDVISGEPDFTAKAMANKLRIGAWVSPPPANWNNNGMCQLFCPKLML